MTDIDYKALAKKEFDRWQSLFERQDEDADFFNMVSATNKLLDANNNEIDNSVHVLLNDIATFTWEVETQLNAAVEQVSVTSESKRFDTAYVEGFIQAAFKEADKLLSIKGAFPFNPFTDQQTFRRGSVATLCNFHFEEGEFIPTLTPWDTRYFVLENDRKGILWTAAKFYRSKSQIISEYPETEGLTDEKANTEVLYIVARDTSQVWIGGTSVNDGKLAKELPNKLGYVPVVYRKVPMGSMLYDQDTIQYQGESGIFLIRLLFKELERIASIIQSLNLKVVDQALQVTLPSENITPNSQPGKSVDEVGMPGGVNELPIGSKYELMPMGQLQAMAQYLIQMIQERMQRGTSQRYRSIANPPTATQIMMEAQEQGNVILPRLGTRGLLKQDLAEMLIKQTIAACAKAKVQSVKLGDQDWEVAKLKGAYDIEYKYHFNDPRMDAARQSLARDQKDSGLIPDRDIRITTLQREDWEEDERQLAIEKARRENPLASMDWEITKLLEAADEGDPYAEDAAMELAMVWIPAAKQAMQGLLTPNMPEELKPSKSTLPIFPGANQGGGQQNV